MGSLPYFSQWENPELVGSILRGQIIAREDLARAASGARTPEEYEWWGRGVCAMARGHGDGLGEPGDPPTVRLPPERFRRFFAARGVIIRS